MSEPSGQTVREILTIMAAGIRRSQCSDEPIRKQTLVKDKAEAAINAHIVSVTRELEAKVEAQEKYTHEAIRLAVVSVLEQAHRANGSHDYDNETDEYIDELIAAHKQGGEKEDE